jgi:putative membrane protein
MNNLTRVLLIAALSLPFAVSAQDAPTPTPDTPRSGDTSKPGDAPRSDTSKQAKLTANELQIMAHYHGDNIMEIELGRLAMKRGTTEGVKSYGEMLVREHGAFDKQLMAIAKQTGQTIPREKPATAAERRQLADMKKTAANIKKLKGANFDREYLRFMVEDHHHALTNIDSQVAEVSNPELADALREVKPILQRHHDQAMELQKSNAQAMK